MKAIMNRALIATTFIALMTGCGGGVPDNLPATVDASGVVLLDGQPVKGASVVFVTTDGKNSAWSSTDSSGRFDLRAFEAKTGAVPGSYQVQVSKTVEVTTDVGGATAPVGTDDAKGGSWKNDLPNKYASVATSGIKIEIPQTGRTDLKIELVSKP